MDAIVEIIQANVAYGPYIVFGLLLLAGLNLPISEDVMLFVSATLGAYYPEYLIPYLMGVFWGAYLSDIIAFHIGKYGGPHLWKLKFIEKSIPKKRLLKVEEYYERYGIITLLLGRFIPFGVRNVLFMAAGLVNMRLIKFALADLLACTITTAVYFPLYYIFGKKVIGYVQKSNYVIFTVAVIAIVTLLILKRKKKLKNPKVSLANKGI